MSVFYGKFTKGKIQGTRCALSAWEMYGNPILWNETSLLGILYVPHMKQLFLSISSRCCFSALRSANVSMITPKIRLRTITMTTK
jgi:hypothetical protein